MSRDNSPYEDAEAIKRDGANTEATCRMRAAYEWALVTAEAFCGLDGCKLNQRDAFEYLRDLAEDHVQLPPGADIRCRPIADEVWAESRGRGFGPAPIIERPSGQVIRFGQNKSLKGGRDVL